MEETPETRTTPKPTTIYTAQTTTPTIMCNRTIIPETRDEAEDDHPSTDAAEWEAEAEEDDKKNQNVNLILSQLL